ncbi:CotS family spore coat protein [Clostridium sp. SHJSY1]|uniref:CotS family spore coat protein n=1 Tax=Clostridium sp. SHJSY1 TaxID=2942483 RepID=UPI002874C02A|nr:CotS family spore coat protein [Clostridium sp. SHJSY1]MDS0528120.1 CotS family spore coat protein [Clostridium sp. SHJSY1]
MGEKLIKNLIKEKYDLNIKSIEQVKNTYKIDAEEGRYCIKIIKYQFSHFYFILSAILHLQKRGFNKIPEILKTRDDEYYIEFLGYYAYLTEWIPARESNFDNPIELGKVSEKLAELHECSEGFTLNKDMKPRIGWFSWIDVFNTRKNEILDFQNRINQKAYKSNFDLLYKSCIDEEVERADKCIRNLINSDYMEIMAREMLKRGFCHHDYANHNILLTQKGDIYIIDFDYCIMDTHLHDLSSLIIRAMKNGKWDIKKVENIINNYSKIKQITDEELTLMKYFISFPQTFWQIGLQKYWEQQPWEEEMFLSRLTKYIEDREEREAFVEDFFS